jgi:antitoxin ParD1/3/4
LARVPAFFSNQNRIGMAHREIRPLADRKPNSAYYVCMATNAVNIPLPDPLKTYVDARVVEGEFGTPGEYIQMLIRDDWDRRTERLETVLLDALKSRTIAISSEELKKGNLVSVLRGKLA